MRLFASWMVLALPATAWAEIDPKCASLDRPADYNDQRQQDYLANYYALTLSSSPLHAPMPDEPGHGSLGFELDVIPPLSCEHRYVFNFEKTEDTNKSPVAPRLRATFTFPGDKKNRVAPYAGVSYFPPVPVAGVQLVVVGGEVGVAQRLGDGGSVGARFHATLLKTIGDIATAFTAQDPAVKDFFSASTFGADVQAGLNAGPVRPYLALGLLDASTFFYVGDDGVVSSNMHPYLGPTFSLGVDAKAHQKLRWAAEFYGAPGGHSTPDGATNPDPDAPYASFGRYGHLYTLRLRLDYQI